MELQFKETTVQACQDLARLNKAVQIAMESVVPDTRDDIGRILSVCPELCLKSKDLNMRGATVTGELVLTVLYIGEEADGVSSVRMSQPVLLDFEFPAADEDCVLQLRWELGNIQTRAVNPRKISADLELLAELSVNRRVTLPVSQALPEEVHVPVHLLTGEKRAVRMLSICERSFSVNEQLPFPEGASEPAEIIARDLEYKIQEREIVGSRLLLKGIVCCRLIYMPENQNCPAEQRFNVPFSQLVDLGTEEAMRSEAWIEETSDYLELIDTIDGQKLLNLELHALAQVRAYRDETIRFIADAYCNAMPCECSFEDLALIDRSEPRSFELSAEESFDLPEEYDGLLGVYPSLGAVSKEGFTASADLLCRAKDGKLFSMRRDLSFPADQTPDTLEAPGCRIGDAAGFAVDGKLTVRLSAHGSGVEEAADTVRRVTALELDEEKMFDTSVYPSLTAVWPQNETVWELAKIYHSSPESISSMNPDENARPLFIPKSL